MRVVVRRMLDAYGANGWWLIGTPARRDAGNASGAVVRRDVAVVTVGATSTSAPGRKGTLHPLDGSLNPVDLPPLPRASVSSISSEPRRKCAAGAGHAKPSCASDRLRSFYPRFDQRLLLGTTVAASPAAASLSAKLTFRHTQ